RRLLLKTCPLISDLCPLASGLTHPEGIECRLVDRCRLRESLISLIVGKRLPGQWPEQSIHLALVISHLLQLSLDVRDHSVRRLGAMTDIDRSIVSIIF